MSIVLHAIARLAARGNVNPRTADVSHSIACEGLYTSREADTFIRLAIRSGKVECKGNRLSIR